MKKITIAATAVGISLIFLLVHVSKPKSPNLVYVPEADESWYPYNRQFNKVVVLEGVGWGYMSKGLGFHVMTPDGVDIFFETGGKFLTEFEVFQGRLIQVTGTLRKRFATAAPKDTQGFGGAFEYLVVENYSIREIAKVERSLVPK